jgi:hypothetical protein
MLPLSSARHYLLCAALVLAAPAALLAQASARISAVGTVQSISGSALTLKTDAGQQYTVQVDDTAKLVQTAPGSKDLSAATVIALTDISTGDRILVTGTPGADAPTVLAAKRVVLMKSSDIAAIHAAEQADWQKRGSGGLVKSVDVADQTIQVTAAGHPVTLKLQRTTILRRYAPDSVDFAAAVPGTLAQIQPGDQLRVRGDRSADGLTITADEIVSGSFRNIAGPITAVDLTAGTITVKDLTTKHSILIRTTSVTNIKKLDARASAMLAQRASGGSGNGSPAPAAGAASAATPARPHFDLAQAIQHMPPVALSEFHVNDAVMVVGSTPDATGATVTAITVLGGVEQLLSAKGGQTMTLAPWSLGGDAGDAGGAP